MNTFLSPKQIFKLLLPFTSAVKTVMYRTSDAVTNSSIVHRQQKQTKYTNITASRREQHANSRDVLFTEVSPNCLFVPELCETSMAIFYVKPCFYMVQ